MSLFQNAEDATDQSFITLAESDWPRAVIGRDFCNMLWLRFERHADPNFLSAIRHDFYSRFWEMYLSCALEEVGLSVSSKAEGPDILLTQNGQRIWVEAVAPTAGGVGHPDRVPDIKMKEAQSVPDDEILLRYRAAIEEKYTRKRQTYLDNGVLDAGEPYIVAICGTKIGFCLADDEPARIARAVYPIGNRFAKLNIKTGEMVDGGYSNRDELVKKSGAVVRTDVFMNPEYSGLSAVLCSNADAVNGPFSLGADFSLVHNHSSINPIPHGLIPLGQEYSAQVDQEVATVSWRGFDNEAS